MSEEQLRDFVENLNARLVGRSDRELGLRFNLEPAQVRVVLQSCANVREHPKGLWAYLAGVEPTFKDVSGIGKPPGIGKPRAKKTKPEASLSTVPSPLSLWEK